MRQSPRPNPQFKVIGNIPYAITSPLIEKALTPPLPERIVFLVQAEVADRAAAPPGSRVYGALSVGLQASCRVEKLFTVKPGAFDPPPRVDSALLRLTPLTAPLVGPEEAAALRAFVTACFSRRRKQLRNVLMAGTGRPAAAVVDAVRALGLAPEARPETLAPEAFARLLRRSRRLRNTSQYADDRREHGPPPLALPPVPRAVRSPGSRHHLLRRPRAPRRHHAGPGAQGPLVLRLVRQARPGLFGARARRQDPRHPRPQALLPRRARRRRTDRRRAGAVPRVPPARLPRHRHLRQGPEESRVPLERTGRAGRAADRVRPQERADRHRDRRDAGGGGAAGGGRAGAVGRQGDSQLRAGPARRAPRRGREVGQHGGRAGDAEFRVGKQVTRNAWGCGVVGLWAHNPTSPHPHDFGGT